jgi:phosphoribosylformimino-5-aminoimidazole carboxamide ribonucleotide (ProFAR) isomerase
LAAGGWSSARAVRSVSEGGVAGAILGMALYTGALNGPAIAQEFHRDGDC